MGDSYDFSNLRGGAGAVNVVAGRANTGGNRIDNRGGVYAGGNMDVLQPAGLLRDLDLLNEVLVGMRLTAAERDTAARELGTVGGLAASGDANPERALSHMRRFVETLKEAGATVDAGARLLEPLTRICRWLGPAGAAILALL